MSSMHLYINILDQSFLQHSKWGEINKIFKQQSPNWSPGKIIFNKDNQSLDSYTLFIIYVALIYREYLIQNVRNRSWEKYWIPLDEKYLNRKKRKGYYENTWMATGALINNISIWNEEKEHRIVIGIDEKKKVKVGKKKIPLILIAKWLEYGTTKNVLKPRERITKKDVEHLKLGGVKKKKHFGIPARPLFRKARDYISKNINTYYKDFSSMLEMLGS